ncbi:MAG TPA: isoprenylcysteine carboxylmethyltransferase family protein [Opitutaceae bacterium]|jgi:protein-S-isoprenylcysteine O-methyltransferase Ste14|nr:isoprenylcysteine carboxylmethyltransferase family protein [Opitutaceae bacterium]
MNIHSGLAGGFYLLWGAWLVYWVALAWGNKQTAVRLNPIWRVLAVIVAGLIAAAVRLWPAYFGRRLLPPSGHRVEAGLALTFAGLAFAIWARRVLGTNWSGNPTIKVGHELIETGPYRLVRHPIYTGLLLAAFGTLLAPARVADLYGFAAAVVLLYCKLRVEEAFMLRQFPDAYPEYRRRTRALVPFLF